MLVSVDDLKYIPADYSGLVHRSDWKRSVLYSDAGVCHPKLVLKTRLGDKDILIRIRNLLGVKRLSPQMKEKLLKTLPKKVRLDTSRSPFQVSQTSLNEWVGRVGAISKRKKKQRLS